MTSSLRCEEAGLAPLGRMPAVLAGTLALGLGFYVVLAALFIHCGVVELAARTRTALRRGT